MRPLDNANELAPAAVAVLDGRGNPVGTGFFAGNGGLILTAAHVLAKCGDVETVNVGVYFGRTERKPMTATVIRHYFFGDRATDIVVLRVRDAVPPGACYVEPGSSTWCAEQLHAFGFPKLESAGFGAVGTGHTLHGSPPRLQLTSEQITNGYSGGPLVDRQTRAVVAVTVSTRTRDPSTSKMGNECFGVPIERVGAVLARAWFERPADAGDDDTDALVADWVEKISLAAGPRRTWGSSGDDTGPVLTDGELQALAMTFCGCLAEKPDGEVLWRLPAETRSAARSRVREGVDWREAVFAACRSSSSRLRLLAAILHEAECTAGVKFDERLRRLLMLRYSEKALRERAALLRPIGLATVLRFAEAARVDASELTGVREDRDWLLYLVRHLASRIDGGDALAQVMESASRWKQEGPSLAPGPTSATIPTPAGECSLVVVVREETEGGLHAVFWGIPQRTIPSNQQNLGTWVGQSLDDSFREALWAAEREFRRTWHRLPVERITVEFALPRRLFAKEVEHWEFHLTDEPLGTAYPVVLRSSERLYDPKYQASWADWDAKWQKFAAEPALLWLAVHAEEKPQNRRMAIKRASAVSLCAAHSVDLEDRDDPIRMCINSMVPVVLWRRSGGDSKAKGPQEREHVVGLRAWVWAQRQAASTGEVDDSVVLLWDDPQRIPRDAQEWRENLGKRIDQ